jgi:ribonuclease inhibitor
MEETVIVVPKVIQNKEYLGEYGQTMLRVFRDAAEENPALTVQFKEAARK